MQTITLKCTRALFRNKWKERTSTLNFVQRNDWLIKKNFEIGRQSSQLEVHGRGNTVLFVWMGKNESESKVSILLPLKRNNETNWSAWEKPLVSKTSTDPVLQPPRFSLFLFEFQSDDANRGRWETKRSQRVYPIFRTVGELR